MKNCSAILISLVLAFSQLVFSQESSPEEIPFEVSKVYAPFSISTSKLNAANTLIDLNPNFKPLWIRSYFSVTVSAICNGWKRTAIGINDTLSQAQKEIIRKADPAMGISVSIVYLPENSLQQNDTHEINFNLNIEPAKDAVFPDGEQELYNYLRENVVNRIQDTLFRDYDLAAIKFTVSKEGHIEDVQLFQGSGDEKTDVLMLEAIRNMQDWKPATYSNGVEVKQEFAFTVGNMENCIKPLLGIRKY